MACAPRERDLRRTRQRAMRFDAVETCAGSSLSSGWICSSTSRSTSFTEILRSIRKRIAALVPFAEHAPQEEVIRDLAPQRSSGVLGSKLEAARKVSV